MSIKQKASDAQRIPGCPGLMPAHLPQIVDFLAHVVIGLAIA